jgi:hypothetical protein
MKDQCTLTDVELIAKIDEWNGKLCRSGGRDWRLTIPPRVNEDPDILIAELCKRFELLIATKQSGDPFLNS